MTTKVDIFTKNIKMTDRLEEYVTRKVTKLYRYLKDIDEARVDLSYIKSARNASDRQVAQITLHGKGYILRTEERADDTFTAIDAAVDKMQRQISRLKGKRTRGRGDGIPLSELAAELPTIEDKGEQPEITRRKTFSLIPMDELEAIEQMKLLAHEDFFVFYNMDTESINILYRRRDGNYGIIHPKLG